MEVVDKNGLLVEIDLCVFCDTPECKSIKQKILGIIEAFPSREVDDDKNGVHT